MVCPTVIRKLILQCYELVTYSLPIYEMGCCLGCVEAYTDTDIDTDAAEHDSLTHNES